MTVSYPIQPTVYSGNTHLTHNNTRRRWEVFIQGNG